jgi:hypothetical protein
MEIHPVEGALMQADGRTDMVKSIGTVCDYAKAPKMIRKKD